MFLVNMLGLHPKSLSIVHPNRELSNLCLTVLALPINQVSVEKKFSGSKYIMNDLRMSLTFDAIFVLRINV